MFGCSKCGKLLFLRPGQSLSDGCTCNGPWCRDDKPTPPIPIERIEVALGRLGSNCQPPDGWEDRVMARATEEPSEPALDRMAGSVFGVAILLAGAAALGWALGWIVSEIAIRMFY